ncbi:serine hydrolase domain-containing protein [Nocardia sp. NPDC058176]|uniref:serine hydrolase domain-containing protein n=1 Tax=Nocardia sp. NPDC058176 TaxID=3346368 RepID=UPI0036DF2BEC
MIVRLTAAVVAIAFGLVVFAPPADASRLDSVAIAEVVEANLGPTRLPGVAVAVVEKGHVLHTGGYGHDADGAPVSGSSPMRIASLSKSFTALAVLQLVEAGAVALDDPVVQHLPEFASADPRADRITLRNLLDHSSGMSDTTFPEGELRQPESLRAAVASASEAELAADPGEQHMYHNPNYWVAARLVEVVSGLPFATYLDSRILGSLGMNSTVAVDNWRDAVPGLVDGHNRFLGITWPRSEPDRFVAGSAGMVSTADDLARWMLLNLGDTSREILSPAGISELHRPSAPDGHYALGWDNPPGQPRQISHSASSFTSTATMVLLPDSGVGIAVLSNSRVALESDTEAIMEDLIALALGESPRGTRLPLAFIADVTVLAAGVAVVAAGARQIRRSRSWAAHRKSRLSKTFGVLVYLCPAVIFVCFTRMLELVTGGRGVSFRLLSHVWPTLLAVVATTAVVGLTIAIARALALRESRNAA